MSQRNVPRKRSRASKRSRRFGAPEPKEIQKRLTTIDQVLRLRFRDYSSDAKALAPLNSILDLKTLDDVFAKACSEKTFEKFCLSVARICCKYESLTESRRVAPKLVIASVFNNHVATVLGKPGKITAQFLKMSVRRISPQLADQLDFKRAKSEPTVFVFGNNVSRICDLIFTIPYKDGRQEVFPLIVLMEHKSAPDRNVVKQMLTSLVATLDFAERYPERFKTPDGKIIWPFVVLFYTGVQQWNETPNLPDLFTTSLKELDRDWIFKLRFLFVSLIDKRIDVVPSIEVKDEETRDEEAPPETFDEALKNADWLEFFFDLLRRAELLTRNPNATRKGWLNDVGESLRVLKDVYDPTSKYDVEILDDALSFVGTMCAKKNFDLPTRDELVDILEKEEIREMTRATWLLSDAERDSARRDGKREGMREGKREGMREGKQEKARDLLAQLIGLRFPTAPPEFVKAALKPLSDSYETALMTAIMSSDSLEEFQKRVQELAPKRRNDV